MRLGRKVLAGCLTAALLLSLLPNWSGLVSTASAADGATIDAFGIRMSDWTAAEKKKAEGEAPFGVGYNMKTALQTRAELYVSLGYDRDTRRTGVKDWNNNEKISDLTSGVTSYNNNYMTQNGASYTFVETTAMDLNNTGKDEYIATLAYTKSGNVIQLFVTDTSNRTVAGPITVASGNNLKQMEDLDTYELRGAMTVAAGDFDGDGKDTIVVYIPTVDNGVNPYIREYSVSGGSLQQKSVVSSNVFDLLRVTGLKDLKEHDLENQPMVSLVAEDTDKDGFDELVITGGMNDVDGDNDQKNGMLGSQLFIYEWTGSAWNRSFHTSMNVNGGDANQSGRIVWASATVGNMAASTSTDANVVDYPEILAAGMVDGESKDFWNINVDGSDQIGVTLVQIDSQNPISDTSYSVTVNGVTGQNVVCNCEVAFQQKIDPNGFTKGGFYESDDVNSLLAVQAFADKGTGAEESVFISGTVYQVSQGGIAALYTPDYFNERDDGASSHLVTNAIIQTVVAGNFDGNSAGQEQLLCATSLRQSGKNNSYSQLHCIYNSANSGTSSDSWQHVRSDYLVSHKGAFYITLNAVDTDNDSTIVTLKDVTRSYSQPDVLAILEATPYFREIGDGDTGNGQTVYGTSSSSGSGSSNTFGFSAGVTVGYESDTLFGGGGFEVTVDNSFNWSTANSKTTEWSIEYANDTGDNLVVVYRCPVVSYLYEDQNGNELVVNKTGAPATSMIPVDDYNAAATGYNLQQITDSVVDLATPGNPLSYRSSASALSNALEGNAATTTAGSAQTSPDGWVQYASQGTTQQALSESTEQEKTFEYGLDVSFSIWGKVFGAKVGGSTGFSYSYSNTSVNGTGVSKSGSVTGQQVDGYDFQWKFVTWQASINANKVPVLGYLVQDVVAPPFPAQNLTVDTITRNSITLSWDIGDRPAQQYRIYRVLEDSSTPYVLVGAADGNTTSYTLTGLQAGTTYTYVVRGVGYDDVGNAQISVDSSAVTARTTSADAADVTITLTGVDEEGILQSSGESATVTANVYNPTPSASTSYQWQVRAPGNARWVALTNGDENDGIGKVSGATGSKLTLTDIDGTMNGGALRCVVTVSAKDGTPEYYYSAIAPMNLEGNRTTTNITLSGQADGTGVIGDPYTALSDYVTSSTTEQQQIVQEPVTVEQGGKEYDIYTDTSDEENPVYVAIAYDSNGTAQYYAAEKNGETYTVGTQLEVKAVTYHHYNEEGTEEVYKDSLSGFDGSTTETASDGSNRYIRTYLFKDGVPTTEYWYKINATAAEDKYYTRSGSSDDGYIYTPVEVQSTDDLRSVYLSDVTGLLIVDEADGLAVSDDADDEDQDETETQTDNGYEKYELYTLNEEAQDGPAYAFSTSIWAVSDSCLYQNGAPYADQDVLTAVLESRTETSNVTTYQQNDGTTLTLSAAVSLADQSGAVSTQVDYVITNTSTGSKTTLVAASGSPITWRAPSAGLYQITATARKTGSTLSSSASCYYYARAVDTDKTSTEYRLVVNQDGSQVTNTRYSGQPVTLTLQSRPAVGVEGTPSNWTDVKGGVTYTVNGESTGSTYTPACAGVYDFAALIDGVQVAASRLDLSKIPISVAPYWDGMDEVTTNVVPDLTAIQPQVTKGTMVGDDGKLLAQALTVTCALYDDEGNKQNVSGAYDVVLAWATDEAGALTAAAEELQSKYEVTLLSENLYSLSNSVVVTYSSGENGSVYAVYRDESGTELPVASGAGTSIPLDYAVTFTATPHSGYVVDQWTVNGQKVETGIVTYPGGGQTLTLDLSQYKDANSVGVEVTFANDSNTLHFVAGENGSISAADSVGNPLTSGSSVAHGADVTFTAVPETGYMVDHWTVDNITYNWPDTEESYRKNTLTLEDMSAGHTVAVFFTKEAYTQVSACVVDPAGLASSAATVSVTDTDGKAVEAQNGIYTVRQDTALVFTAHPVAGDDNTTVREWQTSTNGQTWTTVTGSGGQTSLTIYNPTGEILYVRAMVDAAQSFTVNWNVQMSDGSEVPEGAAVLTAASSGVALTNGRAQSAYIPVEFALELNDAYYVVDWSDNVTGSGQAAHLESLTGNAEVTVIIAHKPVVTIPSVTGGTVTVTGTVNGQEAQPVANGGYVDYNTDITVTLTPAKGYVVGSMEGISPVYTDGTGETTDSKCYTVAGVLEDLTVDQAWAELPSYEVTYSVVDVNGDEPGGTNGTMTATVERKGMSDYDQAPFISGHEAYQGSSVTFTAFPMEGCRVQEWQVDGQVQTVDGTNYIGTTLTLTDLSEVETVTVQFMEVGNRVTVSAGENGSITSAKVGSTELVDNIDTGFILASGASVEITAQPEPGYEVAQWQVNGVPAAGETGNTFTYTAESEGVGAAVAVTFRQVEYTVSWSGTNGTVSAQGYGGSSASIRGGTQVTFTAEPNPGYVVAGWTVNGQKVTEGVSGGTMTWTVPNGQAADVPVERYEIRAIFSRGSCVVTLQQSDHGTITANVPDLSNVTGGTDVTFTAQPEDDYIVVGWIVDGETTDSRSTSYTVRVEAATTVSAVIVPSHYAISYGVSDPAGGTIAAEGAKTSPISVAYGGSVTFTADPNDYYHVSGWQVDGELVEDTANQSSFTLSNVTQAHTVTAVFAAAVSYEVSYAAEDHGSLSVTVNGEPLTLNPGQHQNVWGGSELVFTAQPDNGYMTAQWEVSTDGGQHYTTVTKDNMTELGVKMVHPLSNVLTVENLNRSLTVRASFETYKGYDIPADGTGYVVSGVTRLPDDTAPDTQIRDGGDVTFTVGLTGDYSMIGILTINGYDCIAGTGTATGCQAVTAEKQDDGSYTITLTGVSAAIDADIEANQVVIGDVTVPDALKNNADLNSVDKIQDKLEASITGSKDEISYMDIALMYWDASAQSGNGGWVEVHEDNFPEDGVDVVVSYDQIHAGADSQDAFTVAHMIGSGENAGTVEIISGVSKQADGLHFHVNSLSPFAISWKEYVAPAGGGGGGGAVVSNYSVTAAQVSHGTITVNKESAAAGDTVTVTVAVDAGYTLSALTVTDKNGKAISFTDKGDGSYTFTMPESDVTVSADFRCDGGTQCPGASFHDLDTSAWYHEAVDFAIDKGLMTGVSEDLFAPGSTLTRAMMVTILWRLEGQPVCNYIMPFDDVAEGTWYTEAVRWAASEGIVNGVSETEYAPDTAITREQLAAILYRYGDYKGYDMTGAGSLSGYTDGGATSSWAIQSMEWAVGVGLVSGKSANVLDPTGTATRAEVAQILMNFCGQFAKTK